MNACALCPWGLTLTDHNRNGIGIRTVAPAAIATHGTNSALQLLTSRCLQRRSGKREMKQKTSQILYAYWNEVRGNRIAPRRFDIEPARIGSILPETFILERVESGCYRFRLAGTRIFEAFGSEFRGLNFLDLWIGNDRDSIQSQLATLTSGSGVAHLTFDAIAADGRRARFESILLPLTHTSHVLDRIVGSISCISPPAWLGTVRLERNSLIEHDLIQPDGFSSAKINPNERQAPFAPHMRDARLVRSERRQFRVYEGGLSKLESDKV